jgi:hypothetical protein
MKDKKVRGMKHYNFHRTLFIIGVGIFMIFCLFSFTPAKGQCSNNFVGTFSVGWGMDNKGMGGAMAEAGWWGLKIPFTIAVGVNGWESKDTASKQGYNPTMGFKVYGRIGFILFRSDERRWFNEIYCTTNSETGVSLSYKVKVTGVMQQ